jgi:hypothetical protein
MTRLLLFEPLTNTLLRAIGRMVRLSVAAFDAVDKGGRPESWQTVRCT